MDWIQLAEVRVPWRILVNMTILLVRICLP
jgi:hypothetical protein